MRKLIGLILIFGFAFYMFTIVASIVIPSDSSEKKSVGIDILQNSVRQTGAANAVTSIVVLYRGFDTLGEVTVLFLSALGIALLMKGGRSFKHKTEDESFILKTGSHLLFPFMFLFGIYIIAHGHLTPGGGFPGGVIIATGFFIVLMTSDVFKFRDYFLTIIEGFAGLSFIVLGIVGLFTPEKSFLVNFMNKGVFNTVFSAGIIPLIYAAIGIKVSSELSGAVGNLFVSKYGRRSENE